MRLLKTGLEDGLTCRNPLGLALKRTQKHLHTLTQIGECKQTVSHNHMKGNKFPCVHTDTHTLVVLFYQLKNGSVSGTSCCGTGVKKKKKKRETL